MAESIQVVVRFSDGKLLKGTSQDFNPARASFHLIPSDGAPAVAVDCRLLKAVFFVRSLEGNPRHGEILDFLAAPAGTAHGKKIAVRFKDGEFLCGYTLSYRPDRPGFFVFPVDPDSNNIRIFVMTAATAEVRVGAPAEAFAKNGLPGTGG
jgi:uncharacterized protein DUF6982